jgi:hypothetical protein
VRNLWMTPDISAIGSGDRQITRKKHANAYRRNRLSKPNNWISYVRSIAKPRRWDMEHTHTITCSHKYACIICRPSSIIHIISYIQIRSKAIRIDYVVRRSAQAHTLPTRERLCGVRNLWMTPDSSAIESGDRQITRQKRANAYRRNRLSKPRDWISCVRSIAKPRLWNDANGCIIVCSL